jgi:hypothetical protein
MWPSDDFDEAPLPAFLAPTRLKNPEPIMAVWFIIAF